MSQPKTDPPEVPRLLELDLLRLVAALMVVCCHYMASATARHRVNLSLGPIFDWGDTLARITYFGQLGVDIFFMISGYVIALSAQNRSVRAFLASRAARILPAFWFCCLLTWFVITLDPGYRDMSVMQLLASLFLVARPLGYEFVDGVYWSLVVEVRFYLIVAALIWWRGVRGFHVFLVFWLALAAADMFGAVPGVIRFILLPQFAPYFIVGGALYLIGQRQRVGLAYALLLGSLALACVKTAQRIPPLIDGQEFAISAVLILSAFALWLVATTRSAALGRPWMRTAGALTFPLYLLHEDLGFLVMRHFPPTGVSWIDHRVTITLLAVLLFLLLSQAVVRFVERPLAPRLRRWLSEPTRRKVGVIAGEGRG